MLISVNGSPVEIRSSTSDKKICKPAEVSHDTMGFSRDMWWCRAHLSTFQQWTNWFAIVYWVDPKALNGAMVFSSTIWLYDWSTIFQLVYIFSPLSKDRLPDEMICHLLTLSQPPSRSGWCHDIQLLAIEVTRCKNCARSLNLWTPTEMAPSQRRHLTGYAKKVRTGCVRMFPDVRKGFQKWHGTNKNKGLD